MKDKFKAEINFNKNFNLLVINRMNKNIQIYAALTCIILMVWFLSKTVSNNNKEEKTNYIHSGNLALLCP